MIYVFVLSEKNGAEAFWEASGSISLVGTKLKFPESQGNISPKDGQGSGRLDLGTAPLQ